MFRLLVFSTCATLFWIGCGAQRAWRVQPGPAGYALSKGKQNEPYAQMLERFNGFQTGSGWVDLRPSMRIQIENAYYEPGRPKRGLDGFIGTERVWYRKPDPPGLVEGAIEPKMLAPRPAGEPAVQTLLGAGARKFGAYRLFFSVRINRRGATRGAVLLGAPTQNDLEVRAAALLADPDAVCREGSTECTVFPEVCTVSPESEVKVNGEIRAVTWGTPLSAVARNAKAIKLFRTISGNRAVVPVDPADANALRLPLLPGDEVQFN